MAIPFCGTAQDTTGSPGIGESRSGGGNLAESPGRSQAPENEGIHPPEPPERGRNGKTITEIAAKLGVLKVRVQSWFSGTGKKCAEVRKIGTGRWRVVE